MCILDLILIQMESRMELGDSIKVFSQAHHLCYHLNCIDVLMNVIQEEEVSIGRNTLEVICIDRNR